MRALWISELHPEGWLCGLRLCGVLHEQAGGKAPISVEARPRREHLCVHSAGVVPIRSSLQEPDSDSESEKGDAEAASASKPDVPVIDVDSSDEQSLDEIPDALAWLNIKIEPPAEEAAAEEAPAEETPAEKASAEEAPAEEAPGKAPAEEAEAMDADTEDVANEPQRKRIRRKRPPQPVPVPKVRPMNILDVAPSEESAPGAPEAPDADTNAAEAPTKETGNVQAEAPPPEETGTAQPAAEVPSSSTGDQGWTAEEWELWTEAVRASNKKGSKSFSSTKGSAR